MNEIRDPLEEELRSLCPQLPSAELRARIARQLSEPMPSSRLSFWKWTLAGSLTAACLVVTVWRWGNGPDADDPTQITAQQPATADVPRGLVPSFLTYQLALANSPEELENVLNKQAVMPSAGDPELQRVGAFTHSKSALHSLLGDN